MTATVQTYHSGLAILIGFGVLIAALALFPELNAHLQYQRGAIASGEVWRLLTGHAVHLGWQHAVLNLLALTATATLFNRDLDIWDWLLGLLGCSLLISAGLWFFAPHIEWYVGLSGTLYALLAIAAWKLLRRNLYLALVVAGFLLVRLSYEQWYGPSATVENLIDGRVITSAHLFGAVSGVVLAVILDEPLRRLRLRRLPE